MGDNTDKLKKEIIKEMLWEIIYKILKFLKRKKKEDDENPDLNDPTFIIERKRKRDRRGKLIPKDE